MRFDYLKTIKSVPLDFSKYRKSERSLIISIGKSGLFMYESFIKRYPYLKDLPRMIIVPTGIDISSNLKNDVFLSTHPEISDLSFLACEKLISFIKDKNPENITVLLSGGSSALIEKSNDQQKTIEKNRELLKSGKNIVEINSIRSENSLIKNGKFAELFPDIKWQVFVMSDIPFENGEKLVGSMPFFRDNLNNTSLIKCADSNTLHDHLINNFKELEFTSIRNFNDSIDKLEQILIDQIKNSNNNLLVTGEPVLRLECDKPGIGGRMTHLALKILPKLDKTMRFYALSSDGIDGFSPFAGAAIENVSGDIYDILEINNSLRKYDSARFLKQHGFTINTGYTGINLNDIIILIRS